MTASAYARRIEGLLALLDLAPAKLDQIRMNADWPDRRIGSLGNQP